jgi:type II secretory pathway pseudopilin PulG
LLRDPDGRKNCFHSAPSAQGGFSYLFALFAIVLVGLSMMGANAQWKTMMQREREVELLFRGDQYRRAIKAYVEAVSAAKQYPLRVEDLLKDPRTSKRHLRMLYPDPMTGEAFAPVLCGNGRVKGVASSSEAATLKRDNFPPAYAQFTSATTYRQWIFQYDPSQVPAQAGSTAASPPPC